MSVRGKWGACLSLGLLRRRLCAGGHFRPPGLALVPRLQRQVRCRARGTESAWALEESYQCSSGPLLIN